MKCFRIGLLVLCLAVLVQFCVPARPASALMVQFSLEQLTAEAQKVVSGRVLGVTAHWNSDKTSIYSSVNVGVFRYFKGLGSKTLTVEVQGGTVGDLTQWVEDAPSFEVGQDVVLFLKDKGTVSEVVGLRQGKYTVVDGVVIEAQGSPVQEFLGKVSALVAGQDGLKAVLEQGFFPKGLALPSQGVVKDLKLDLPAAPVTKDAPKTQAKPGVPSGVAPANSTIILSETFEGAFPGAAWRIAGAAPNWDDTSYRAKTGWWSGWCAESTLNAPGPYVNGMNTWMVYGPFSLAGVTKSRLQFTHWTKTETGWDRGMVLASSNGSNFSGLQWSGDFSASGWLDGALDLAPWLGQPNVWIAFAFQSDGSIVNEGIYLDDIVLWKSVGADSPVIASVTPGWVSAGTNANVAIVGSNFGAIRGTGAAYFWRVGGTWLAAPIISWSDTRIVCRVPAGASSSTTTALRVRTNGGLYAYGGAYITFSYSGVKWQTTSSQNALGVVRYYVNSADSARVGQVRAGAHNWDWAEYNTFALRYYGYSSRAAGVLDGYNVVDWGNLNNTGIIAVTSYWYYPGKIVEFDMRFNTQFVWSTAGVAGQMDVQNIGTHEFGHTLVLLDLYGSPDSEKTMYGYGAYGETKKRSLAGEDAWGAQYIYP